MDYREGCRIVTAVNHGLCDSSCAVDGCGFGFILANPKSESASSRPTKIVVTTGKRSESNKGMDIKGVFGVVPVAQF
jgi:hypothetical protein